MYFKYNDEELVFKFEHQPQPEDAEGNKTPRYTKCTVTKVANDEFVAQGVARVHPNDNFDREKGRQYALGRALQEFVPKAERLPFWQAYQNWKTPVPRLILSTDNVAV